MNQIVEPGLPDFSKSAVQKSFDELGPEEVAVLSRSVQSPSFFVSPTNDENIFQTNIQTPQGETLVNLTKDQLKSFGIKTPKRTKLQVIKQTIKDKQPAKSAQELEDADDVDLLDQPISPADLEGLDGIQEPEGFDPGNITGIGRSPALERARQQILSGGDLTEADKLLDLALKEQQVISGFRPSLDAEALLADRLRAFNERREGRTPSNQLTKLGVFGGERTTPGEELSRREARTLRALEGISGISEREASGRRASRKTEAELLNLEKNVSTELKRLRLRERELSQKSARENRQAIENDLKIRLDNLSSLLNAQLDLADSLSGDAKRKIQKSATLTQGKLEAIINRLAKKGIR